MRAAFTILGLTIVAGLVSCSAPVRDYVCVTEAATADVDVYRVWSCNRDVIRRAAARKPFSLREFESAAVFFERLTGIVLDSRSTHLGRLPGPDLREDLAALDAWYESNRAALRWDAERGEVVFERLAPPRGAV